MFETIVLRDAPASCWRRYSDPVAMLSAATAGEVVPLLETLERRVREEGLHAAGFVAYEAAPAFDTALVTRAPGRLPLACFGLFRAPQLVGDADLPAGTPLPPAEWRLTVGRDEYVRKIAAIREQIAAGNTYQVNYTVRQLAAGLDDPWSLFLAVAADAPYAAYLEGAGHAIVSASPELFFELNGDTLVCRPMKGTAPRGLRLADDLALRDRLLGSSKDRAENVMIADMLRNDLGRVADAGTVRVAALCEAEKYRTVWQLTSTVRAASRAPLAEVFRALFPCASVTGAPKVASMQLIARLENSPREVYTGAIGFVDPGRKARFSVAIRTAVMDRGDGTGTYGVGGGIVWDSRAEEEYQECLDKTRILGAPARPRELALFETLLWTPADGWFLREAHMRRLADSAAYFDFAIDPEALLRRLDAVVASRPPRPCRVRLQLARDGSARVESTPLPIGGDDAPRRVRLAAEPVDRGDPLLYHKTTERAVYERARAAAGDCDDVLLWNAEGEVTESTIANLVVRLQGRFVTPPVECGLLPGTFREHLLRQGRIREGRVHVHDLPRAEEIWLVNSVRGWMRCRLLGEGGRESTATAGKSTAAT